MGSYQIAVIGAGITGLTQALWLQRQGHQISLFDRGSERLDQHCSHVGAGMLAPYCELSEAEDIVAQWGAAALKLWQAVAPTLALPVHLTCAGTLVVAHHRDRAGLQQLADRVQHAGFGAHSQWLRRAELGALEPELAAMAARISWMEGGRKVFLTDLRRDDSGYDGTQFAAEYRRARIG